MLTIVGVGGYVRQRVAMKLAPARLLPAHNQLVTSMIQAHRRAPVVVVAATPPKAKVAKAKGRNERY